MQSSIFSLGVLVASIGSTLAADFLQAGLVAESDAKALLSAELLAVGSSSDSAAHRHLESIKDSISTMYASLPKNSDGLLTHQAVRYALHRFFARRHGWFIRGLEPNNDTWHPTADPDSFNSGESMNEWVPSFLQEILEQKLGQDGTDLDQLSALAAALEDLIRREAKGRLEGTFEMYEYSKDKTLTREETDELLLTYYTAFLNWGMLEASSREQALRETENLLKDYPAWTQAKEWFENLKSRYLSAGSDGKYDFQSLLHLVDKLDEEYSILNDRDCGDLKDALRKMQGKKPGRVRLSALYQKGTYRHWDFGDKQEYLSSLGVLDETEKHPSVIITNYILSRPNCLDSSHLFTICCRNECEDLMTNLESKITGAMMDPSQLVQLVSSMSSSTMESNRELSADLVDRLFDIARRHGGQVPVHGRLFAQWMHHAYPLECPFPNEMGAVNPLTRGEWMKESGHETEKASKEEMEQHIASDTCSFDPDGKVECEGETADIAWSDKEELLTWRSQGSVVDGDRGVPVYVAFLACVLAAGGLFIAVRYGSSQVAWKPLLVTVLLAFIAFTVGLLDGTLLLLVLGCGAVVVVANQLTAGNVAKDGPESKHCV